MRQEIINVFISPDLDDNSIAGNGYLKISDAQLTHTHAQSLLFSNHIHIIFVL